jgi:hypothetical protein
VTIKSFGGSIELLDSKPAAPQSAPVLEASPVRRDFRKPD